MHDEPLALEIVDQSRRAHRVAPHHRSNPVHRHLAIHQCFHQQAAVAQSTSLGFPTMARVFTPHPIQDRTDDEIVAYADAAFDEIVSQITAG